MAYVIEAKNPFNPWEAEKNVHQGGVTLRAWLQMQHPGFVEFPIPTICIVNGEAKMRSEWDQYVIQPNDVVGFVAVPGDPFTIIAIIVAVAVIALSVAIALTTDVPKTPGELPASDPVFSNRGQQNQIRLGEPIEVCYGRNRIYPSLASRPFYKYSGNDQFQYSLFCLGQGQFDIEQILIGDTDIGSFQEVEYEVIPPGDVVTLFPTNVITSIEAGGQTLFAPNEPEYVAPGYVGPFAANPPGTVTEKIEVDIIYPKGIYLVNSKGNLTALTIQIQVDARKIDDAGAPLGSFFALTLPYPLSITAATTTPQRRTYSSTVPGGRYEVRVRRIDTKDLGSRSGHDAIWEGMRAFIDTAQDFGNVTLIAVKIRATNNLNDQTATRFNSIATRMLPIRTTAGVFGAPVATRSLVWAYVDSFRAQYGGRVPDAFFAWDELEAYDAEFTSRGEHFDWIFRDPITVWEAAKSIARVGRAAPLVKGSLVTMRRDEPLEIPVAMFSPENIVKGSFAREIKLWDVDEYDSVAMEYTEVSTGYKQEIVLCTLPGGTTDKPEDIRLIGCQSRQVAYQEGLFYLASKRYLRENIKFDTGLEGHIPSFGDLIIVSYDVAKWGQSGYVVNAQQAADGTTVLWLSEPLDFSGNTGSHVIQLRGRKGEANGPYNVLQMDDAQQIMLQLAPGMDFQLSGNTEPMLFLFGTSGNIAKLCKVVNIEPQGGEGVRITAVNYVASIHSYDGITAPALNQPALAPQAPDIPEIDQLYLTQIDDILHIIQIAWTPAFGALEYVVQTSEDGANWQERAVTAQTSLQVQVRPGTLYARVAARGNALGPWIQDLITISLINVEINDPWSNDLSFGVQWWQVLNATGYEVKVYHNEIGFPLPLRTETLASTERSYAYTYAKAVVDGVQVRKYKITVDPIYEEGVSGSPAEIEFNDSIPPAPTWSGYVFNFTDPGVARHYIGTFFVAHHDDLHRVKIWLELATNTGFNPATTTPYIDDDKAPNIGWSFWGSSTDFDFVIPLTAGAHPAYIIRIALFDVWGTELTTNITSELPIAAFP
jgi:hypothetical protein